MLLLLKSTCINQVCIMLVMLVLYLASQDLHFNAFNKVLSNEKIIKTLSLTFTKLCFENKI